MSNWHKIELGEVGNIITGKTPPTKDKDNYGNEYMFIGPTDLHKHFILKSSEKMISKKGLDTIKGSILEGTSILVGCIGWDMGNVAIVTKKCATNQQINSITNIKNEYNPLFIYYWLKNKKDFLFSIANVTRTPILNKTDFSKIEINVPTKNYQNKIVSILSSLDKKIELNNKINQELEAMAKTLYDYWFVQFDFPDANGKPYKSSGGKMVYSEELKREIPKGWDVKNISDLLPVITGKEDANFAVENGQYPFFTCSDKVIACDTYAFDGKAILVAGNGNFDVKLYEGKFNAYQRTYVLITDDKKYYALLYFVVKDQISMLTNSSRGSIIKFITKGDLENIPLVLPKRNHDKIFNQLNTIIEKIEKSREETQKLTQLRDWLLPMLMNGQVKV